MSLELEVPVVVSGVGIVSTLGCSIDEMTLRFAAGERPRRIEVDGEPMLQVEELPLALVPAERKARLGRLDRLCRMVLGAAYLAFDSAGLHACGADGERIGISFGTGLGCLLTDEEYYRRLVERGPGGASPQLFAYTVSSAAAGEVSIALGIKGPNVTAHQGLAAGLGAIGYGFDLVQIGKADVVLAGGADVIGAPIVRALRDMDLLKTAEETRPFRDSNPGICPSEGAAILVLEREDNAVRRGAQRWARIDGYAAGFEPTLTRRWSERKGLTATMRRALQTSRRSASDVGTVVCSSHGTSLDETERGAVADALGDRSAVVLAPKQVLGETFGAGGALHTALAIGLIQERPALAAGLAFGLNGRAVSPQEASHALRSSRVVMVDSLCYSGNLVTLLLSAV